MIKTAETLPSSWQLRMGVHCGPVVAGIVGRQQYLFDIWGDTVNAAARMQVEAEAGTLCVNGQTWKLLRDHCQGRSLGIRKIKGKGENEIFEVQSVND